MNALNEHAKAIRSLASALGKQTLETAIEIGRRLVECRSILKQDGKWRAWLKTEFKWNKDTAHNLINVYDLSKSGCLNFRHSDLPLSALYELAKPTTSKETRDDILARSARGEKLKHKEVASMVRKTKAKPEPTGLKAEIIKAVQNAANGLTTDQLKAKLARHNPQTVNSTTNALKKADILRDNGERRETRSGGGRPAEVYVYNPDPKPAAKKSGSNEVADLNNQRIIAMIEDDTICRIIEKWAAGKSEKQRVAKAYKLIVPLIGNSRSGILRLGDFIKVAEEESRIALAEGRAFVLKL